MTISIANNALENCISLEDVVNLINDEMGADAEAEMIAAAHAFSAAKDCGYTDDASIEGQLDFLADSGAVFDFRKALEMALAESLQAHHDGML